MHRSLTALIGAAAIALAAAACHAAPLLTLTHNASVVAPKPWVLDVWRGDSVTLTARLMQGDTPLTLPQGATGTFYWQTNGMERLYWPAPASVSTNGQMSVAWTPLMDCGADSYKFFFAVNHDTAILYRVFGTLRLQPSPGAVPNELPLPTYAIDFGAVVVTNAPWATIVDFVAATNELANAIKEGVGGIVTGDYLPLAGGDMGMDAIVTFPGPRATRLAADSLRVFDPSYGDTGALYFDKLSFVSPFAGIGMEYGINSFVFSSLSGTWAWGFPTDEVPGGLEIASRAWVSSTLSTFDPPDTDAKIAAATNSLIQTYILTSNSWMIVSNNTLSIYAPTGSVTTASLVWESVESSGASIDPAATNLLWQALSSGLQGVNNSLAAKAPKAWGQYAPDGSANPDPDFMTFLNAPATVLAGGSTWATSDAYSVLVAADTVAFASGASGELRIGPDLATNWFGYRQGGSYIIGARANSITTHDVGTTNGYATIVYDYDDGDFPVMWFTPALGLNFVVSDAVWVDNQDGSATATVPAQAARGFYRATTTANIDSLFVVTMPSVFEGGVIGSTNATPVIFDSTITVTSGGRSYRIPAQEVR